MEDRASEKRRQRDHEHQFSEQHGYTAGELPRLWISREVVVVNPSARGTLEAINDYGYVLSHEGRLTFASPGPGFRMELYDEDRHGARIW